MLLPNSDSSVEYVLAYFIKERMDIFWARIADEAPYTSDPIFNTYKFTNVYRVTDRVSQYLIRHVQYNQNWNEEDLIFRTLFFKNFNLPSTWEGVKEYLGTEPTLANFNFDTYCKALDYVAASYPVVYNNAYMMTGHKIRGYSVKHYNHMGLFEDLITRRFFQHVVKVKSMGELFATLVTQPYIGPFLGYQYATDLNYTPLFQFDENSFCVAGLGSKRGIEKLLFGKSPKSCEVIIKFYVDYQDKLLEAHKLHTGFVNLFGRPLQMIDMQNCFCEVDKYLRVFRPDLKSVNSFLQRTKIKNKFKKSKHPYTLFFPPWWNLPNDKYTLH